MEKKNLSARGIIWRVESIVGLLGSFFIALSFLGTILFLFLGKEKGQGLMLLIIYVLIIAAVVFAVKLFRMAKIKSPLRMGLILGVLHFTLVIILLAKLYFAGYRGRGSWEYTWGDFLLFLDFPSSALWNYLAFMSDLPFHFILNGLLGSAQYFLFGAGVGWLYNKINPLKQID